MARLSSRVRIFTQLLSMISLASELLSCVAFTATAVKNSDSGRLRSNFGSGWALAVAPRSGSPGVIVGALPASRTGAGPIADHRHGGVGFMAATARSVRRCQPRPPCNGAPLRRRRSSASPMGYAREIQLDKPRQDASSVAVLEAKIRHGRDFQNKELGTPIRFDSG